MYNSIIDASRATNKVTDAIKIGSKIDNAADVIRGVENGADAIKDVASSTKKLAAKGTDAAVAAKGAKQAKNAKAKEALIKSAPKLNEASINKLDSVPSSTKSAIGQISSKNQGWKLGDSIDVKTKAGNDPSWSTVRSRYWKNEAHYNYQRYSTDNVSRMQTGRAPIHRTMGTSKELHHINGRGIDNPHCISNLQPVWPWEHAEIDPFRHYNGPMP